MSGSGDASGLVEVENGGTIIAFAFPITKFIETSRTAAHYRKITLWGFELVACGCVGLSLLSWLPALLASIVILSVGELLSTPGLMKYYNAVSLPNLRAQFGSLVWIAMAFGESIGQGVFAIFPYPRLVTGTFGGLLMLSTWWYLRHSSNRNLAMG